MSRYITKQSLDNLFNRCRDMLFKLGHEEVQSNQYTTVINNRFKSVLGRCKNLGGGRYEISFNGSYLQKASDKAIMETCLHELAHSCKYNGQSCMNHQAPWHAVVNKINSTYSLSISRTTDEPGYREWRDEVRKSKPEYHIICGACGKDFYRTNNCTKSIKGVINYPNRYGCPCCHMASSLYVEKLFPDGNKIRMTSGAETIERKYIKL